MEGEGFRDYFPVNHGKPAQSERMLPEKRNGEVILRQKFVKAVKINERSKTK
jgi:hypothetical protein